MLNGITITVVGMLTVFLFLSIMVLTMALLKKFVARFLPDQSDTQDLTSVAVAIAAAEHTRKKVRSK